MFGVTPVCANEAGIHVVERWQVSQEAEVIRCLAGLPGADAPLWQVAQLPGVTAACLANASPEPERPIPGRSGAMRDGGRLAALGLGIAGVATAGLGTIELVVGGFVGEIIADPRPIAAKAGPLELGLATFAVGVGATATGFGPTDRESTAAGGMADTSADAGCDADAFPAVTGMAADGFACERIVRCVVVGRAAAVPPLSQEIPRL